MTAEQLVHHEEFMAATRGADAWTVAQVLSRMTPGRDWRKCSRALMARAYADAKAPKFAIVDQRAYYLTVLKLDTLRGALEAALLKKGKTLPSSDRTQGGLMNLDKRQQKHYDAFMAATNGVSAWVVSKCLTLQAPSIEWSKSSRGEMAGYYAEAKAPVKGRPPVFPQMGKVDLERLRRDCAEKSGVALEPAASNKPAAKSKVPGVQPFPTATKRVALHMWRAAGEPEKDSEPTSVGRGWYEDRAADVLRGLAELGYVVMKPRRPQCE
jgi:hypothetical protein